MTLTRRAILRHALTAPAFGVLDAAATTPDSLAKFIDETRAKASIPGLAVLIHRQGSQEIIVTGVRARGAAPATAAINNDDLWHIGSCAKAMTATLLGRLVEKGALSWTTTVSSAFPHLASSMDSACAKITVDQLLTMTAGLAENPSNQLGLDQTVRLLRQLDEGASPAPPRERRMQVVRNMLAEPPRFAPGTKAAYSNTGYIIAGAMAEAIAGDDFESLLAREVLRPLGIARFGFGAPGSATSLDQPRGHKSQAPLSPDDPEADLPVAYRPAGGLHISLTDWAMFVSDVLAGLKGQGKLLQAASYQHLLTPTHLKPLGVYAAGWAVLEKDSERVALAHTGSNHRWFASVNAYPKQDLFFLMASNDGRPTASEKAFAAIRARLKSQYAAG